MKTPAGIAFSVIGFMMLLLWIGPLLLSALTTPPRERDPEAVLLYGPLVVLAICVMSAIARMGRGALYFTPAEIDFLFPAPVSRLDLLLYKMVGMVAASAGAGVFFGVYLTSSFTTPIIASILGGFLAVGFVNLTSVAAALVKENVVQHGARTPRVVVIAVIVALIALLMVPLLSVTPGVGVAQAVKEYLESPIVWNLLWPLRVFVLPVAADSLVAAAFPLFIAAVMNFVVFIGIMALDALNIESALESSRRQHERLTKAARGGSAIVWKRSAGWRLPLLTGMGGIGPILWRQATTALRNSHGLLLTTALMLVVMLGLYFITGMDRDGPGFIVLIGPAFFFALFLVSMVRFDFRGDLDQLEWLKMLPIATRKLVLGQLFTPVMLLTSMQWLLMAVFAATFGHVNIMLACAVMALPLNLLLVGMENLLFLMYPTRQMSAGMGDLQALGRNMVLFMVRGVALLLWMGLSAGAGAAGYFLLGGSWIAAVIVAWMTAMAASSLVLPAVVAAFGRFDVSRHMPA